MAAANYKVTVIDHDYHRTTYVAWVGASSKNQAIALGAALAGQEKMRLDHERRRSTGVLWAEGLTDPEVLLERVEDSAFEEFWDKRGTVEVVK